MPIPPYDSDISDRIVPWNITDPARRIDRAAEGTKSGCKAAHCILWHDTITLDDGRQVLEVTFNVPRYVPGTTAYLLMVTHHVQYAFNDVYVNRLWLRSLEQRGQTGYYIESFPIEKLDAQAENKVSVIVRDRIGGQATQNSVVLPEYERYAKEGEYPNIDMIQLSDAQIIYVIGS